MDNLGRGEGWKEKGAEDFAKVLPIDMCILKTSQKYPENAVGGCYVD